MKELYRRKVWEDLEDEDKAKIDRVVEPIHREFSSQFDYKSFRRLILLVQHLIAEGTAISSLPLPKGPSKGVPNGKKTATKKTKRKARPSRVSK